MYIHRIMETKLKYLSEHFPVVMVCGARQVGKTYILREFGDRYYKNSLYINFERMQAAAGRKKCFGKGKNKTRS